MRSINMHPKWKDVKPSGYYIYEHRRATDGSLFYIGKGSGRRGWDKSPRSDWWTNIAMKNGVIVSIPYFGMTETDAHSLEVRLIADARGRGENICNMSDGGEGSSGCASVNRKTVWCSNGMVFDSTIDASDWVSSEFGIYTCFSAIAAAASGTHYSAYGLCWSYTKDVPKYVDPSVRRRKAFSVPIVSGLGEDFTSLTAAQDWLRGNGYPSASSSKISLCLNGKRNKAYDRTWSRSSAVS